VVNRNLEVETKFKKKKNEFSMETVCKH
jgi:hypothetical protein